MRGSSVLASVKTLFPLPGFMMQMWLGFDNNFQFAGSVCLVAHLTASMDVPCGALDRFGELGFATPCCFLQHGFHPLCFIAFSTISNVYGLNAAEIGYLSKITQAVVYKLSSS